MGLESAGTSDQGEKYESLGVWKLVGTRGNPSGWRRGSLWLESNCLISPIYITVTLACLRASVRAISQAAAKLPLPAHQGIPCCSPLLRNARALRRVLGLDVAGPGRSSGPTTQSCYLLFFDVSLCWGSLCQSLRASWPSGWCRCVRGQVPATGGA